MNYRQEIQTTEELAAWYDAKYKEMGDGWNTPAEECHRHLDDLGVPFDMTRRLLDVGFGAGHFLAEAEKRVQCTGIEISSVGWNLARKRCRHAELIVGPMEKLLTRYDYVVSIGSLEHIVDLDGALDTIRILLKPEGKFYFYCPNERWNYFDQPNERTMVDYEWKDLFNRHGLRVVSSKRWGDNQDNTAFIGVRDDAPAKATFVMPLEPIMINAGSGQRPFDRNYGWVNIDCQDKYDPDIVADWNNLSMFADNSVDKVVAHHTVEHVGLGEADAFIKEAHRVLKPSGSFLVFVPDMRALAQRWLTREIDDYTFFVNVYGAFMGDEADRHKWNSSYEGWCKTFADCAPWTRIGCFDWRTVPGADIARAWWILGLECVK